MDILKQCQKWHEKGQYQKIIDALEAIPAGERTPEMDSELARAYNNLADPYKPGGKEMLKRPSLCSSPMRNTLRKTTAGTSVWDIPITFWTRRAGHCRISARHWRNFLETRTPKTH